MQETACVQSGSGKPPGEVAILFRLFSPQISHHLLKPRASPFMPEGQDRSHRSPAPAVLLLQQRQPEVVSLYPCVHLLLDPH